MPVSTPNSEYNKHAPLWKKVSDCVEGSVAIKQAGTVYLPKPNEKDSSDANTVRYNCYVQRASFVGFTGFTKVGLLGMVFGKDTALDLPPELDYQADNSNGAGLSLDQAVRAATGETLEAGRYGLLTDYPPVDGALTREQQDAQGLQANIIPYEAKNIINWQTVMLNGVKMLSLVVLREIHSEQSADGFQETPKAYHRVLRLLDGVYVQELYNDKDERVMFGEMTHLVPTKADGSVWDKIPFTFIGSQNNDECADKAPLLDIAEVNIAHYRNSADYEESSFMVGQPTPYVAGLSQTWVDEVMKGGVMLGSRAAWMLPEGGSAGLLQASENQMPMKGMVEKEMQMVKIGARIIMDSSGNETAEAAKIRFGGQNSQLAVVVGNVEAAYRKALGWAQEFMGGTGEIILTINRQFYDASIDPQLIVAEVMLLDRGIIAKKDLRAKLRDSAVIASNRTDDEIDSEAEQISPI